MSNKATPLEVMQQMIDMMESGDEPGINGSWYKQAKDIVDLAETQKTSKNDELLVALEALLDAVKSVPEMNNARFDSLGIQVNNAISRYKSSTGVNELTSASKAGFVHGMEVGKAIMADEVNRLEHELNCLARGIIDASVARGIIEEDTDLNGPQLLMLAANLGESQVGSWDGFGSYLLDKCEGEIITEESLQFWASRYFRDPQYCKSEPLSNKPCAEEVQWRNIKKVIKEVAEFCFGGPNDPKYGHCYLAVVHSLTAKDGIDVKLEPLPK